MTKRSEHTFQFVASRIAEAAQREAEYHEGRLSYWQEEYEASVKMVESTISAKVIRRPITGGETVDVVIEYGDPGAWKQAQRADAKMREHREAMERFQTDVAVYGTQDEGRSYELDIEDIHHFRLAGEPRPE